VRHRSPERRPSLSERGVNRMALTVFGGGAVFLAPWIVLLYFSQPEVSAGYHLKLTSLGMSLFIVAGLIQVAVACRRRSPAAPLPASYAATLLFIAAWFNTITVAHGPLVVGLAFVVFVHLPAVVLTLWVALRVDKDHGGHDRVPGWVPVAYLAAATLLIPWFAKIASVIQRTSELHNLRLFWVSLDVCELVGMALTAWCLYRGSSYVVVTSMITGSLLFSDAWFNVATTIGLARRAAVVMALVEVPTAAYAFVIARREVWSWQPPRLLPTL
jgi:hypothetical protein